MAESEVKKAGRGGGGRIVRVRTSVSCIAEYGVSSAGFTTVVQPAASAAPIFRVIIEFGKFH